MMKIKISKADMIEHDGGDCPIEGTTAIPVLLFRDGSVSVGEVKEYEWRWDADVSPEYNITHYAFLEIKVTA